MKAIRSILRSLACLGALAAIPALASPTVQWQARGQAALAALTQGKFEQATQHFAPETAAYASPAMLQSVWNQLVTQLGAFRQLGQLQPRHVAGHGLLATTLAFANGKLAALVDCDADNRITTFRLAPASILMLAGASSAARAPVAPKTDHVPGLVSRAVNVPSPLGPLPGLLDMPEGAGPFPAVVFVAGSGPNDMDETIGPNKPFRDLADGLAKRGIASLRYDKRTFDYGSKIAGKPDFTVDDEVTDDALTALHLLAKQKAVDPHRVFVLGHSLGAMLAPRIAKRDKHLAGVIMLAAPARSFLAVIAAQIRELGPRQGASSEAIAKQEKAIAAEQALLANADPAHPPRGTFELLPGHAVQQAYLLSLSDYHQVVTAQSLTLPMLILQGGNDFQVSPKLDFDVWKKALAGKPNVTFHLFPGLSHLFMPGPTKSPADYARPAHVEPAVVDFIAKWITAQPPNRP